MATNPKPITHAPWGEYVPQVGVMTAQEFERFPEENGWKYKLHQGKLVSMPGPGYDHGAIQSRFIEAVNPYMRAHALGRLVGTGCYVFSLAPKRHEVLCPDLSYVLPAHARCAVSGVISSRDTRPGHRGRVSL